jgi:hypothetical protein
MDQTKIEEIKDEAKGEKRKKSQEMYTNGG